MKLSPLENPISQQETYIWQIAFGRPMIFKQEILVVKIQYRLDINSDYISKINICKSIFVYILLHLYYWHVDALDIEVFNICR